MNLMDIATNSKLTGRSPEQLIFCNTGASYIGDDGRGDKVILRTIEPIGSDDAVITILLAKGQEVTGTVNRTQAFLSADQLDLIREDGKLNTIESKVVYYPSGSDELTVILTLTPTPPLESEGGIEENFALFLSRGDSVTTGLGSEFVIHRTLRVHEDGENATFTLQTASNKFFYKTTTRLDAIAKAVPGDFFVEQTKRNLNYVLGKRNLHRNPVPLINSTPIYDQKQ